jgi:hypothetical protein
VTRVAEELRWNTKDRSGEEVSLLLLCSFAADSAGSFVAAHSSYTCSTRTSLWPRTEHRSIAFLIYGRYYCLQGDTRNRQVA